MSESVSHRILAVLELCDTHDEPYPAFYLTDDEAVQLLSHVALRCHRLYPDGYLGQFFGADIYQRSKAHE